MSKLLKAFFVATILFGIFSTYVYAAQIEYKPLTDLPIFKKVGGVVQNPNPTDLISGIYVISIGVGSILAVVMITFSGIQYMTTGAITGKIDAKKRVWAALGGLVLLLSSYLILKTINIKLVEQTIPIGSSSNSGLPSITK